jgi:hypothetical protein
MGTALQMAAGISTEVGSIVAWNPKTKEITSGPAKGQTASNENEAITKHKAAVEAANEESE